MENEQQINYTNNEQNYTQQASTRNMPVYTNFEFLQFIVDPQAREEYEHITKDLATSNASEIEIKWVMSNLQLLHLIDYQEVKKAKYETRDGKIIKVKAGELDGIRNMIRKDIYSFLQVLRSKNGFERQLEATQILKQQQTFREETPKRKFF